MSVEEKLASSDSKDACITLSQPEESHTSNVMHINDSEGGSSPNTTTREKTNTTSFVKELSILDRLLTPLVLLAMIVGVIIGEFVPGVQHAFDTATFGDVSLRE